MPPQTDGSIAAFIAAMPEEIAALEAAIAARGGRAALDRSYESIDRLEDHLLDVLPALAGQEREETLARAARYVGQTLVERAGGQWALRPRIRGRSEPCVLRLPDLGDYALFPRAVVNTFAQANAAGVLREETENYDLPHRRSQLAALLAAAPQELAAFAEDLREVSGEEVVALDQSLSSLEPVGRALARIYAARPPRERRRQVRDRAVLYVGQVIQRALGRGDWSVSGDPDRGDFGQFTIAGWAPRTLVGYLPPADPGAWLREEIEQEIEARR